MKKLKTLLCLLLFSAIALAETVQIAWQKPIKWDVQDSDRKVLAFDRAIYPDETGLPWWNQKIDGFAEIQNPIYEPCNADEIAILAANATKIGENLQVKNYQTTTQKITQNNLTLLPFVQENGIFKKLKSFEIKLTDLPQKALQAERNDPKRYAANSVLKNGTWQKIKVEATGIHKITFEELNSIGMASENVKIFGYGGNLLAEDFTQPYIDDLPEVAIFMEKGSDGIFNAGDFILFYARGTTGWHYSNRYFSHTQNFYATAGYYFITTDGGERKKMEVVEPYFGLEDGTISSFTDYYVHEKDLTNLIHSGREFYGEEFGGDHTLQNFSVPMPNVLAESATARLDVAARYKGGEYTSFKFSVNGLYVLNANVPPLEANATHEHAKVANVSNSFLPKATDKLLIQILYNKSQALGWLNYFELNIKRALTKVGDSPLFFRNIDHLGFGKMHRYTMAGGNENTQVWDITNPANLVKMPTTFADGQLSFVASTDSLHEYVAVNTASDQFLKPTFVGTVANQNLHALPQTDYVIISHADFLSEANRLAEYHRQHNNLRVTVVDHEKIFNEFSSGTPDGSAYRRFVKMFYDRAQNNKAEMPKYLLLFGDGCFDNRGILHAQNPIHKLLTYQSTNSVYETQSFVAEDYFGFLDDTEGISIAYNSLDIAIGRFPVYTQQQASDVVDKTIGYMENKLLGNWKNQAVFLADDDDDGMHMRDADDVAKITSTNYPDLLIKKLYLDAYQQEVSASGERYPLVKEMFLNYIKFGSLVLNYMGHGSYNGWANEQILLMKDVENMYNDKLPFWVTATCDFARFDDFKDNSGDLVLRNPNGGGIALFTTTRTVHAAPNYYLNREMMGNLMRRENGKQIALGEVLRISKNNRGGEANKLSFVLLGDPALVLASPNTHKVVTDSIDYKNVSEQTDTLRALDKIYLAGHITDLNGQPADDFNGYVHISVFDKEESITTLANDQKDPAKKHPFTYKDRPNPIFQGKAYVKDGKFNFSFLLPKDIRYNFGTGKIIYYAADEENNYEGNGSFADFVVGGENPNFEPDNSGPQIHAYLNSPDFVDGGKVNETPVFIAHLYDVSGLNTIGSGIGHDMIIKLDNNPLKEWSLNNYYESTIGSYQEGEVRYKFTELPEGKHTLTFRAWDLQNNSSSVSLNFEVVKGLKPVLYEMYAYPNPATTDVKFVYKHDRPESPLDIQASVFDLQGRLIWKSDKVAITNTDRTEIDWDLWNGNGVVRPGIYLVRMEVSVAKGEKVFKTIKLIIK